MFFCAARLPVSPPRPRRRLPRVTPNRHRPLPQRRRCQRAPNRRPTARPPAKPKIDITLLAPADEYFGPLRQSIIGINNTIRDIGRRYDVNHDIPTQSLASAELTERSIRDWEKRYPHDTQLPRSVYLLQRLYTKVLSQPSRDRAHDTATWLFRDFNGSPQAKQLKKTLAVEHLAPLPPPTPRPTATPVYPSVFGPSYPSRFSPASGGSPPQAPAHSAATATARPDAPVTGGGDRSQSASVGRPGTGAEFALAEPPGPKTKRPSRERGAFRSFRCRVSAVRSECLDPRTGLDASRPPPRSACC